MNGFGLEVAAIITALATLIGVILTSRYNAAKIADLQSVVKRQGEEIEALKDGRRRDRKRVSFLKKLLMQREQENNRLLARDKRWTLWGDEIGRLLNQQQIEIGALQVQLKQRESHNDDTQPLPNIFDNTA